MIYTETLSLIRAVFPKWNFFDKQGAVFRLLYQDIELKNNNHWIEYEFKKQNLNMTSLFLNAEHNLNLAKYNIIEHFVDWYLEKSRSDFDLENHSCYHMLCKLVEDKIENKYKYKFKIEAIQEETIIFVFESKWLNK